MITGKIAPPMMAITMREEAWFGIFFHVFDAQGENGWEHDGHEKPESSQCNDNILSISIDGNQAEQNTGNGIK